MSSSDLWDTMRRCAENDKTSPGIRRAALTWLRDVGEKIGRRYKPFSDVKPEPDAKATGEAIHKSAFDEFFGDLSGGPN